MSAAAAARMQEGTGQVMLDPHLCDALFKGVLKKGDTFPTHLPKREVTDAFLKRMLPQQRLSRGPQQVLKRGSLPQISMQAKQRQGNKKVTCVQGLEVGD
jgi:translation initiation factor 2D